MSHFRRFLHLKAQAPEVSNEQVITQVIKALHADQLDNYLFREHPRMLEELYDNFRKFNKSEVLHFCKLEQQRKVPKENEASRSTKYNRGRESTMKFDNATKQIHIINSDGYGPLKNRAFNTRKEYHHLRGSYTGRGRGRGRRQDRSLYCMYHERDTDHWTRDYPVFLESKKKMTQKKNQSSNPPLAKEVNHTTHWQQPSSLSYYPSYQHSQEHQPTYHRQPLSHYQSYHYASTTNQTHPATSFITYPLPLSQITYPMPNTLSHQPKTEPNTLPPPPAQQHEPSHPRNNFPTFGTIHTITEGSNLYFQNK
jgi:hypothetical protein